MKASPSSTLSSTGPEPVLCVVGWWPGANDVTGIFIREHVQAIARTRPVEVLYLEVVKSGWPGTGTSITQAMEHGLPVRRITVRTPIRRFGMADLLVRSAFRKIIRTLHQRMHFALLHIHVRTEVTERVTSAIRGLALPVVVTEHNTFYHRGFRTLPESERAAQGRAIRRWFNDPAIGAVMPVSHDLAGVLHDDFGVPRSKITVVPNIAAAVFQPGEAPQEKPFHIVLAALWRPPKDHDVLLSALRLLPAELAAGCRISWAGYGPDMETIEERCRKELPGMDIRFPGRSDKSRLADLMRSAHLFILPTTAENLPCVLLESLCCGTPVISMAVNGVPEVVDASNGILIPPRDPKALASAMVECMLRPGLFDRASIARAALARYAPEAVGARIAEVYARVLRA